MRIQLRATGLYYGQQGDLVRDIAQAEVFGTSAEAVSFCRGNHLCDPCLVYDFGEPDGDVSSAAVISFPLRSRLASTNRPSGSTSGLSWPGRNH